MGERKGEGAVGFTGDCVACQLLFSYHRVGALTESILLEGSVASLLALHDCSYASQVMLSVYFDRRITKSSSSTSFFVKAGSEIVE